MMRAKSLTSMKRLPPGVCSVVAVAAVLAGCSSLPNTADDSNVENQDITKAVLEAGGISSGICKVNGRAG